MSLAWQMRARGYRTICVHPFDRRFYGRDVVLGNLGFEVFLGEEAFPGAARNGLYIADVEIARLCIELLHSERALFLFAITMENHGPWNLGPERRTEMDLAPGLPPMAQRAEVLNLLAGLRGGDAMLGLMADALTRREESALLALYGDHLPSLPLAFEQMAFTGMETDYVIWTPRHGEGLRRDLPIHSLGAAITAALDRKVV